MTKFEQERFEEDIKIQKEAYATISLFQLISQASAANLTDSPEETFITIGGMNSIERLITNCKEGNIDIFNNSISDLYNQLEENIKYMGKITSSKSTLTKEAVYNFSILKNLYSNKIDEDNTKEAYVELSSLCVIPYEKMLEILKLRPRAKKIGER